MAGLLLLHVYHFYGQVSELDPFPKAEKKINKDFHLNGRLVPCIERSISVRLSRRRDIPVE